MILIKYRILKLSNLAFWDQNLGSKFTIFEGLYLLNATWRQGCVVRNIFSKICVDDKTFGARFREALRNMGFSWFSEVLFTRILCSTLISRKIFKKFRGGKFQKLSHCVTPQCGNFKIFLSLRFYVKSIFESLQVLTMPF